MSLIESTVEPKAESIISTTTNRVPRLSKAGLTGLMMAGMLASGSVLALDRGDAPTSYGSAEHGLSATGPYIGDVRPDDDTNRTVGVEDDATSGVGAGDSPVDDEDGVFAFPVLIPSIKAYSTNVFVNNPGATDVYLAGWVDFNRNGVFDDFEGVVEVIPAGSADLKVKLVWSAIYPFISDIPGPVSARFRIATDEITTSMSTGSLSDGEVEDYALALVDDTDGDTLADTEDTDDDNDGIPDSVEGTDVDTDNDGLVNSVDTDSDGDQHPDSVEAGDDPTNPVDTDNDGIPDYLDPDSDNDGTGDEQNLLDDLDSDGIAGVDEGTDDADGDGVPNYLDVDSDNDSIPDSLEGNVDTDGDGIPNYLDLDSDNDTLADVVESGYVVYTGQSHDTNGDHRIDLSLPHGENGMVDALETATDSGVIAYTLLNTDNDSTPNYLDVDSDDDGKTDMEEAGATGTDADADGTIDSSRDSDGDGVPDSVDVDQQGGADADGDGIVDSADIDYVHEADDTDGDGIIDSADPDANGDGMFDDASNSLDTVGTLPDDDNDGLVNVIDVNDNGVNAGTDDPSRIETSLDGGVGCTLNSNARGVDPMLLVLLVASAMFLWKGGLRRRKALPVRSERNNRYH